jgi:hypothetical protein
MDKKWEHVKINLSIKIFLLRNLQVMQQIIIVNEKKDWDFRINTF